jgi:hypothetical protein
VPAFDTGDKLFHFRRHGVIHYYGNAAPAGSGDQFSGFFDRFRPPGWGGRPRVRFRELRPVQ